MSCTHASALDVTERVQWCASCGAIKRSGDDWMNHLGRSSEVGAHATPDGQVFIPGQGETVCSVVHAMRVAQGLIAAINDALPRGDYTFSICLGPKK